MAKLSAVLVAMLAMLCPAASFATVIPTPPYPGASPSLAYKVAADGQPIFTYRYPTYNQFSWMDCASFSMTGKVHVTITNLVSERDVRACYIRPIAYNIQPVYRVVAQMAPMIMAHQGKDSIIAVRLNQGDAPKRVALGNYTLELSYTGRGRMPIAPEPKPQQAHAEPPAGQPGRGGAGQAPMEAAAIPIAAGPDEFYMGGGGFRIAFTANTPGPETVGLGIVQEGKFVDGKWVVTRQLGGDDIGQGEIPTLRPNTILRVVVYRYD